MKGKESCYRLLEKYNSSKNALQNLGSQLTIEEGKQLEEYVCCLHGFSKNNVDIIRWKKFNQKQKKKKNTMLQGSPPLLLQTNFIYNIYMEAIRLSKIRLS